MRYRPSPTLVALLVLLGALFLATGPRSASEPQAGPAPTTPAAGPPPSVGPTSPLEPHADLPTTSTASPTPTRSCVEGIPTRIRIPSLGVDAGFEQIGVDRTAEPDADGKYPLGNPRDRTLAGWYSEGPRPGSGVGTILTNGHTYRNNSAIFKEDFARRVAVGQTIQVTVDNGSTCSYAIERVWQEVNAERDYPRIVTEEHLYDFSGPERLFLTTCGGSWNAASQDYDEMSLLIAIPLN